VISLDFIKSDETFRNFSLIGKMITKGFSSMYKITAQRHSSKLYYESCVTLKRYFSLSNLIFKNKETVSIGGVIKDVIESKNQELVPTKYCK